MDEGNDARAAGERVETLLAELRACSGAQAGDVAEELVTCLVRLYGAGLTAVMRAVGDDTRLQALLIADPLVESLLLIHDLHPLDPGARIKRALGRLGGGAELLGVDDAGVAHVRLGGGCGVTTEAIEQAVTGAAPETTGVRLVPRDPPLLQISRHRQAGAR
jgi:NifU-like domain